MEQLLGQMQVMLQHLQQMQQHMQQMQQEMQQLHHRVLSLQPHAGATEPEQPTVQHPTAQQPTVQQPLYCPLRRSPSNPEAGPYTPPPGSTFAAAKPTFAPPPEQTFALEPAPGPRSPVPALLLGV